MFGYQEKPYTVLEKFELSAEETNDTRQEFEIRIPKEQQTSLKQSQNETPREYISITGFNEEGKLELDLLLKYNSNTKEELKEDWETLKTNPKVNIKDLNCFRWITGHHIGHCKEGSVTMY
jgi:hypothetical protein